MIRQRLDTDLKEALLSHDELKATVLRSLKSAILYAEVASGNRQDLSDDQILSVLAKEAKKRSESEVAFRSAGRNAQADQELQEQKIIEGYLPPKLNAAQLEEMVDKVIADFGVDNIKQMGRVIGEVQKMAGPSAEGKTIADLVKQKLGDVK